MVKEKEAVGLNLKNLVTDFKKKYLVSSQCDESKFQIEKFFTATARLNQYDFANLIF